MTCNVLITSASRKVSLIKSFQESLHKEDGGKVIAVDINPLSATLYVSDEAYIVPKSNEKRFVPTLLDICKKESVNIIIPTRDEELSTFANNKSKFEKIGIKVMVASQETIEICNDKIKFIKFCKKNNIPIPKTYSKKDIGQLDIDFPLFINDRFGKGSKKAFKVENKKELMFFVNEIDQPIIQEFCNEKEYTIDLFTDFSGKIISIIPRERISTFFGESFIAQTCKNKIMIDEAVRLAKKLHLIGHNTIQCFFDGKGVKFIEVNPRYGGGANLGFAAGANTPHFLIKILENKKISYKIGDFKEGLIMLRYTEDIFIDHDDIENVKSYA
jgi:carbamoyl-phosphate synthase large subunit